MSSIDETKGLKYNNIMFFQIRGYTMIYINTIPVTFGGSTEPEKPYDNFKSAIKDQFKYDEIKCENEISLNIVLCIKEKRVHHNKNDLDNFLKPIIDALAEKRCFNEAQIGEFI